MSQLLYEVRGRTAEVTFNRPEARNAMTMEMYEDLVKACERIDGDDEVMVAVFRGAGGKAFVSGTDIAEFRDFSTAAQGQAYERRIEAVMDRLERVRVPTIAAVQGYAVGGGLGLAASCDIRVCTPGARFGLPIARTLGNCVSMRTYARLASLVGSGRALNLILTAGFLAGPDALAAGLVTEVIPDERFDGRLDELCAQLASHAPLTMAVSKQAFRRLRDAALPEGEDLIATCYGSADFREGVRAFLAKRPPRWSGR